MISVTEHQRAGGKATEGKEWARRRIVLTVDPPFIARRSSGRKFLTQQSLLPPCNASSAANCWGLHLLEVSCTMQWREEWRTGLTGRGAAGGLSDFRIWSRPGWGQQRTSSVVPALHAAPASTPAVDATSVRVRPFKQHPSEPSKYSDRGRAHRDKSRSNGRLPSSRWLNGANMGQMVSIAK